jgi:site-specific DNA-methyltransferase (adenine-specific)
MSDGELAYTSFDRALRRVTMNRCKIGDFGGLLHPTQKPVALYKWLLKNYAKEGDKILDTHLGSGSSRIAAFDGGFEFWGYELDKDYFDASVKRFNQHKSQLKLFA